MGYRFTQGLVLIVKGLTWPVILLLCIGLILAIISVILNPHAEKNQSLFNKPQGILKYFNILVMLGLIVIGYIAGHNVGTVIFAPAFQSNSVSMATGQVINAGKFWSFVTGIVGGVGWLFLFIIITEIFRSILFRMVNPKKKIR